MNKKTIIIVLVVSLLVAAFVLLPRAWSDQRNFSSLKKVTLQLKWLHQSQFAGFYAAAQEGFYKDEGLDVSIIPVGEDLSSQNVVSRVAKGEIEFGIAGAEQVIAARAKGEKVKAVAVIFQQSPVGLISKQKLGITSPRDLVGKSTGIWEGQDTQIVFRAMLNNAGVDYRKVREIPISFGISKFADEQIDTQMIYLINEGLEARSRGYAINTLYPEDFNVHFYGDTIVASDALIEKDPELVERFVRASLKGWNWSTAYVERAGTLSLAYDPSLQPTHEESMMRESLPFIFTGNGKIGSMASSTWQEIENILLKDKIITRSVPVGEIFTTTFLTS